jgi:class 3 adenylate cyclase
MLLYDYLNLADDVRKSEVISFFRDRIAIVRSSKNFTTSKPRRIRVYEKPEPIEKITYNFTPGQKLISDLRNVTLLFLDLRGYTEVSAGNISSEALKQNLYRFFDPAMDIIDHFHGSIKFYAGDAIFASFGSGPWKDYHGLNAVRAAIEIQKIFKALKERGSMVFHGMGIGIHTGLVEDAYFFLNPVEKSTTVIGFTANLTGRLSSGKSERLNQKLDLQSVFTLNEYLMTRALSMHMDPATLAVFEEQLLKILDGIQEEKAKEEKSQALQPEFNVHVIKGVLNNNGIALSDTTFQYIREVVALKEVPSRTVVDYLYEDKAIGEIILFKKAGDASFKGLEGKFPIWGVYLRRWMK